MSSLNSLARWQSQTMGLRSMAEVGRGLPRPSTLTGQLVAIRKATSGVVRRGRLSPLGARGQLFATAATYRRAG